MYHKTDSVTQIANMTWVPEMLSSITLLLHGHCGKNINEKIIIITVFKTIAATINLVSVLCIPYQGSILISRTETSSLSRVVRGGWDPCSVPLSGEKKACGGVFDLATEQPQVFRKLPKNKK